MAMTTTNRPKPRRWFSPGALADFANNSFLTVARGTGTIVRGVQAGSAKSISVLAKPVQKKAAVPVEKAPSARPPSAPNTQVPVARAPAPVPVVVRPPVRPIPDASAKAAPQAEHVGTARAPLSPTTPARLEQPAPTMIAPEPRLRAPEPVAPPPVVIEQSPVPAPIAAPVVFAPPPPPVEAALPEPAAPGAERDAKGVTGFFKSIFRSEASEAREAAKPSLRAATAETPLRATEPSKGQFAGSLTIPKHPIDIEALVAEHPFSSRAEMLGALVSVNEFLSGTPRESVDAQRQILAAGAAFAEPVFLAALQKQSPRLAELALDGLSRLAPAKLSPVVKELLASDRRELRMAALRAAQWLADEQAQPLFDLAAGDPSPDVRRRLVCYLSWRGTPWAMFEVRGLCNDEDLAVRWAAIGVLARSQPDVAAELMGRTPPSDEDRSYRRRVEAALAKKPAGSDATKSTKDAITDRIVIRPPVGRSHPKSRSTP